ncbi:MAG: acyl-CoA dehydrogenase family protein [Acetobacteraceae bacterium]
MDLSLTPSQILIRDSARAFVRRHVPRAELVRQAKEGQTWDPAWYAEFRSAGWTGALVPSEFGGLDLDPLSTALIFEELGRGAVPSPLLASSVIATCLLRGCQPSEQRDAALMAVADGEMILIPAMRRPDTSWKGIAATATTLMNGNILTGSKVFVPFADAATHFLVTVTAPDDATPALAIVPAGNAGISTRLLPGFLQANHEVVFEDVALSEKAIVRVGDASFDDSLAVARVVAAAYQVGGMLEMLDMSVSHSNTRVQFGTPIGRFQRVQDHIIRLLNAMDAAKWATYEAAWAIESDHNGIARSYLAGSTASDSYFEAANAAHEVHAAIGSDPRYGLTLYTRISRTMYELLGPPAWQRRQMANSLGW